MSWVSASVTRGTCCCVLHVRTCYVCAAISTAHRHHALLCARAWTRQATDAATTLAGCLGVGNCLELSRGKVIGAFIGPGATCTCSITRHISPTPAPDNSLSAEVEVFAMVSNVLNTTAPLQQDLTSRVIIPGTAADDLIRTVVLVRSLDQDSSVPIEARNATDTPIQGVTLTKLVRIASTGTFSDAVTLPRSSAGLVASATASIDIQYTIVNTGLVPVAVVSLKDADLPNGYGTIHTPQSYNSYRFL